MNEPVRPFSRRFDLAAMPNSGADAHLEPTADVRAAIAAWAGVSAVDRLEATIRLARLGPETYSYDAHLEADVVQACVVTLEPVRTHIVRDIERRFQVEALPRRRRVVAIEPEGGEDDEIERVDGSVIDLAQPVLEELALGIEPYPRAPGARFVAPAESESPAENPFAVLEKLKSPPAARKPGAKGR
jgi:uncharacterized metal-binding protein YceD (DUF177 family)